MKPEEQRIAIAEWCGLRDIQNAYCYGKDGSLPLPDYLNDLNGMWDAEQLLIGKEDGSGQWLYCKYSSELLNLKTDGDETSESSNLFDDSGWFGAIHATAAQRAEALLRTIGKWKE